MATVDVEKNDSFNHEDGWCPVFCPIKELDEEIDRMQQAGDDYFSRRKFLEGVRHARIIIRAASGGKIA